MIDFTLSKTEIGLLKSFRAGEQITADGYSSEKNTALESLQQRGYIQPCGEKEVYRRDSGAAIIHVSLGRIFEVSARGKEVRF